MGSCAALPLKHVETKQKNLRRLHQQSAKIGFELLLDRFAPTLVKMIVQCLGPWEHSCLGMVNRNAHAVCRDTWTWRHSVMVDLFSMGGGPCNWPRFDESEMDMGGTIMQRIRKEMKLESTARRQQAAAVSASNLLLSEPTLDEIKAKICALVIMEQCDWNVDAVRSTAPWAKYRNAIRDLRRLSHVEVTVLPQALETYISFMLMFRDLHRSETRAHCFLPPALRLFVATWRILATRLEQEPTLWPTVVEDQHAFEDQASRDRLDLMYTHMRQLVAAGHCGAIHWTTTLFGFLQNERLVDDADFMTRQSAVLTESDYPPFLLSRARLQTEPRAIVRALRSASAQGHVDSGEVRSQCIGCLEKKGEVYTWTDSTRGDGVFVVK
jgi:hypothetical protein